MVTYGTMQALMVRLLQVLKLSMVNTSTLKKMVVKLKEELLRMQMVHIAITMLQQVSDWQINS